jgi:hypothetical protein
VKKKKRSTELPVAQSFLLSNPNKCLSKVSRSTTGLEESGVTLVGGTQHTVGQGEFDPGVVELPGGSPDSVLDGNRLNLHNLNLPVGGSVSTSHVGQELVDGASSGNITELLGDVVLGSTALVSQSNLEVLDLLRAGIEDLDRG